MQIQDALNPRYVVTKLKALPYFVIGENISYVCVNP